MKLGIPKEVHPGERRVASTPETARRLRKLGFEVFVEAGAGEGARYSDDMYAEAGVTIIDGAEALWSGVDYVLKVRPPEQHPELGKHEVDLLPEGAGLICLVFPGQNTELIEQLAARKATLLALDCVPRISRAQKMDVLSSMSNISGYRAIIEASQHYGGFFSGQITAAGRTRPAQVLVIGAGVAGLAAVGAARGLGAEVRAFDTRSSAGEQVQSLGASFLQVEIEEDGETAAGYSKVMSPAFIEAEMALFLEQAKEVDIIVTTALIPGKKAPILITEEMVHAMKPGSVVVDLAAEQGGNCALTEPGEAVEVGGVTIVGYTDLTSRLATHASTFFGNNIAHLLDDMGGGTDFRVDHEDEAVRGALVLEHGELLWPPPPPKVTAVAPSSGQAVAAPVKPPVPKKSDVPAGQTLGKSVGQLAAAGGLAALGLLAPGEFLQHFTVFVLACFIGWQVIWNVSHALHTPLMAVTNAISGIIIVGGILQVGTGEADLPAILGAVAILFASINVFGGFLVTQRMLKMFHR